MKLDDARKLAWEIWATLKAREILDQPLIVKVPVEKERQAVADIATKIFNAANKGEKP
jgi:hypothetical protein